MQQAMAVVLRRCSYCLSVQLLHCCYVVAEVAAVAVAVDLVLLLLDDLFFFFFSKNGLN